MLKKETEAEEWKISSFLAVLSNYDYFRVWKNDETLFYASAITQSCGKVLEFAKRFATPVYSEGELTSVIAVHENEFECKVGTSTYRILALDKKPLALPTYKIKKWKNALDFARIEYINRDMCQYIKDLDLMVLVVDPHLLGELTPVEELQIRYFIDTYLRGQSDALQVCRTVYFGCKIHDSCQKIYAGIYDLEKLATVNMTMVYNKQLSRSMTILEKQQYLEIWKTAKEIFDVN